ncbi:C39 family peptidase [Deinococcus multiflagellatus]|uniref:C39 family peptidase n=1 Tax=Deinococcus multiflagellatus TaxID=1656887 RepID=UPI001CCAAFA1|nr:C39 family peptidase [Deinococcus multiflagellatus]MBZ9713610.1 C39 family peptidase [Deinococcus multiflagellatus]
MTQANLQKRPPGLLDTLEQKAEDLADSVLAALGWGQPRAASPQPGGLGRGQTWTRDFRHDNGQLTLHLHLSRAADGQLSGHYAVQPKGKARGQNWPLAGRLQGDDTFSLHGTQNGARFVGSLRGGTPEVSEFKNRKFSLENFTFTRLGAASRPKPAAKPASAPAAAGGNQTASGPRTGALPDLPALREPGFLPRLRQVAAAVNTTPEVVLAFLNLESNLDPTSNKDRKTQYKGLGQIGKDALKDINAFIARHKLTLKPLDTTQDLTALSATQQLAYVEIHLQLHMHGVDKKAKAAGRTTSLEEVYMGHLGGSAKYAEKDVWVSEGSAAYRQNPMDADQDGHNTPAEAADTVRGRFTANFKANLDERSRHLKPTRRKFDGKTQLFYVYDAGHDNGLPLFSLDPAERTPIPAPVLPKPPAVELREEEEPVGEPDALDQLMKLTEDTPQYTAQQIRVARELIKLQPQSQRAELYLILQEKTPHHSQRNNESLGRAVDGDRPNARIGGVMCNLTSAAMVLEQLGIENPNPEDFPQFEDYLEDLRRKYVDARYQELLAAGLSPKKARQGSYQRFHRTTMEGWGKVLALMGASHDTIPPRRDRKFWESTVRKHLEEGEAVMMSINGHIVRLQGMNEQGLIVDDPYGKSVLKKNTGLAAKDKDGQYKHDGTKSGNDTVWSWASVAEHDMLWIAAVKKK